MSQFDPASGPPPVPLPVQPLTYSLPWQHGRPGLVSAIGVLCIVVACLSGFASLITAYVGAMAYVTCKFSAAMMASSAVSASSPSSPPADEKVSVGEAGVVNNALQRMLSLDAGRFREMDRLIRAHGRAVFGGDEDGPLTAAGIRAAVVQYKSADAAGTSAPSFTTAFGTVDIFPDHAVFTSADGTRTLRTSATDHSESDSPSSAAAAQQVNVHTTIIGAPTTNPAQTTTLTAAQVQQVLTAIKQKATKPLNSAQLNVLQTQLSMPDQQLVSPGSASPVSGVFPQGNNVSIQFDSSYFTLGPKGQVVQMVTYGSASMGGGMRSPPPNLGRIGTAAWTMAAESVVSIGLAIYLLIVGILVFRPTTNARRLLRVYAWIKIPLALTAGVVLTWMAHEVSIAAAGAAPRFATMAIWAGIIPVLGLTFPIVLLVTLRAASVKNYYDTSAAG